MGVHAQLSESPIGVVGTHAQIRALATAGTLKPGAVYRITDHQTIHIIPYTDTAPSTKALAVNGVVYNNPALWDPNKPVKDEGVEELLVLAATNTTFSPISYSITYPTDIIHYNINDIVCEDNITPRRGKIIYRRDVNLDIETYYDFRAVKFRRWKVTPNAWSAGTTYAKWALVLGSDGHAYLSKKASNTANDPIASTQLNQYQIRSPWWERILYTVNTFHVATKPAGFNLAASSNVPVDVNTFIDYHTFNTTTIGAIGSVKQISIKKHTTYNNIVFVSNLDDGVSNYDCIFDTGCADSTIAGKNFNTNRIGSGSLNNLLQGGFAGNTTDSGFTSNIALFNNGLYWGRTYQNNFSSQFNNNVIGVNFQYNTFNNGRAFNNFFAEAVTSNNILILAYNNNCNSSWSSNIAGIIQNNEFDITFQNNFVKLCNGVTFGANCTDNKFMGSLLTGTYFAASSIKNVINNDFSGGTLAIPLAINNCVFNKIVTAMQVANTGVVLTGVVSLVSISKTFPISLTNKVISSISPDGSLWAHGIDDTGQITTEKII